MSGSRISTVTGAQFSDLFDELSNWGRWGPHDQRGALHYLTRERVAAAARLVRDGISVSLSLPLNTKAAADNPKPVDHHMTELAPRNTQPGSLHFIKDYVGAVRILTPCATSPGRA